MPSSEQVTILPTQPPAVSTKATRQTRSLEHPIKHMCHLQAEVVPAAETVRAARQGQEARAVVDNPDLRLEATVLLALTLHSCSRHCLQKQLTCREADHLQLEEISILSHLASQRDSSRSVLLHLEFQVMSIT